MKKTLSHFSFWLPAVLFLLHQCTQKLAHISIPILDNYLDPFCFISIAFPLLQLERKKIYSLNTFSLTELFVYFIVLAFSAEYLLPLISSNFVSDLFDILVMFIGLIWFTSFNISFKSLQTEPLHLFLKKISKLY